MDIGAQHYPWVQGQRHLSVTHLEMLHGALGSPEAAKFATFYFRQHEAFKASHSDQIKPEDVASYATYPNSNTTKPEDVASDASRHLRRNCRTRGQQPALESRGPQRCKAPARSAYLGNGWHEMRHRSAASASAIR